MKDTAAEVAAMLALQKFWNANLYDQAAKAIAAYSQRLSKPLAEWATQDANNATTLQQIAFGLAVKNGAKGHIRQHATPAPLMVPPITAGKPDDREAALAILTTVGLSERNSAAEFADAAKLHLSKDIFQILDLDALATASEARKKDILDMKHLITEGGLWNTGNPDTTWRCLKCGAKTKGQKAFEKCPCCEAPRSFATSAATF